MAEFFLGVIVSLGLGLALFFGGRSRKGIRLILSTVEHMRAVGELSVYKVMTKEIVTERSHSWGEIGERYLKWLLSQKKMVMIFEFVIDFRYDLQSPLFQVGPGEDGAYNLTLPPCQQEVYIKNIRLYNEEGAKLLPWLVPDILGHVFKSGFSEEDKNQLIEGARAHAQEEAHKLIQDIQGDVQKSARFTLDSLARAFGAQRVNYTFLSGEGEIKVQLPQELTVVA